MLEQSSIRRADSTECEAASFCRACHNGCPTLVRVRDGRLVSVRGNPANRQWDGYLCVKGRGQPGLLNNPSRLLRSLKRTPEGGHLPIAGHQVLDEIASSLSAVVERHGPGAVGGYFGTYAVANNLSQPFFAAFMRALGSDMLFCPDTIDKPGKKIARAMHGTWLAPLQGYDRPDVALLVGTNPLQSYYGVACGHPTKWLTERLDAGMELIVVDPRRTEIATRSTLHLQPRPGNDVAILSALIHVIIEEELYDREFVTEHTHGLDDLRSAVVRATPVAVAARAGIAADDIVKAARLFAARAADMPVPASGPGSRTRARWSNTSSSTSRRSAGTGCAPVSRCAGSRPCCRAFRPARRRIRRRPGSSGMCGCPRPGCRTRRRGFPSRGWPTRSSPTPRIGSAYCSAAAGVRSAPGRTSSSRSRRCGAWICSYSSTRGCRQRPSSRTT